ncbi:MAG: hypothetical protein ACRECF_02470, partial [Methyloceanibacter sp.]
DEPIEGAPQEGAPSDSGAPSPEPEEDPELDLMVHGERFKIKRSELIEAYSLEGCPDHVIVSVAQKQMAADQRLARVKEREAENPPHGSRPGHSEAPAPGAPEPTNQSARADVPDADGLDPALSPGGQDQPLSPEKLTEIVERIQIGDTDEGAQALGDLVQLISRNTRPENVEAEVRRVLAQQNQQAEIDQAIAGFASANSDLVANSDLEEVVLTVAAREIRSDMKRIGVPEEAIKALGNDKRRLADAYHGLRARGYPVRPLPDLLNDVGTHIRTAFNMPAPAGQPPSPRSPQPHNPAASRDQTVLREARKLAASPQPRPGSARAPQPQGQKPRSPAEILAEMRQERQEQRAARTAPPRRA